MSEITIKASVHNVIFLTTIELSSSLTFTLRQTTDTFSFCFKSKMFQNIKIAIRRDGKSPDWTATSNSGVYFNKISWKY